MSELGEVQVKPKNKNKIIIGIIISLIIILVGVGTYYYFNKNQKNSSNTQSEIKNQMGANIQLIEGSVMVQKENSDRFEEAKANDSVYKNYKIKTGESSKAVLVFDTGDIARLDSNTEVKIIEISSKNIKIENLGGEVYSRVDHVDGKNYEVVVSDYSASAIGTAYSTKYNTKDNNLEYKVLDNKIKISKLNKELNAGQKAKLNTVSGVMEESNLENSDIHNGFIAWNKDQDLSSGKPLGALEIVKKNEEQKQQENNQNQNQNNSQTENQTLASLGLSGWTTENGVALSWQANNLDVSKGFKVIKAEANGTPVYPGNDYQYLSSPSSNYYEWGLQNGETYSFRVCTYNGSGCSFYSNIINVTAPNKNSSSSSTSSASVNSISLSGSTAGVGKVNLSWSIDGNSPKGFKIVWSKNSGPTYPLRSGDTYHYLSNSGARADSISGLESGQTYYFRVCEYLGGKCGLYSNEISIQAN